MLTVGINGTLAGTGTIQRTATINGTLAPGDGGPGILSVAGVSFVNGSTFAIEITSVSAFDQLNSSGSVSLSGTINLALTLGFDPSDGLDSFVVLANDAADAIIGTGRLAIDGNPLEEGETFFVGSQEFRISYTGGTGNDVVLDAVPEPTTCILLIVGSSLLGGRRFRKSNAPTFPTARTTAAPVRCSAYGKLGALCRLSMNRGLGTALFDGLFKIERISNPDHPAPESLPGQTRANQPVSAGCSAVESRDHFPIQKSNTWSVQ